MVFAFFSRMLGHGAEVEDLAQETFDRAYRAFPAFDPEGPAKVSTWLLTIASRLALEIPENTAKTRLFRAREKMRAALTGEWRTR